MPSAPTAEELRSLKGTRIQLPELLKLFGTRVRSDQSVLLISQALKNAGLSTLPYFGTCSQSGEVSVVALESVPDSELEEGDEDEEGLAAGALPLRSFKLGDLPAAQGGVDSVTSRDQLTEATHLMRTKNYSQIPVMDDPYTLTGVVTWRSVGVAYATTAEPTLARAMVDDHQVAEARLDFFKMLPIVSEHGYLLVRGHNGRFTGIVTSADITERFHATAWPFFVLGEIEARLRKCLGTALDAKSIRVVQRGDNGSGSINDLTFGQYVLLLDGDPKVRSSSKRERLRASADRNWAALGWTGIDRVQFVQHLDRVRDIRNKIAHFDSEPLSSQLTEELGQFARVLRDLT